jgi:hypothetical protein
MSLGKDSPEHRPIQKDGKIVASQFLGACIMFIAGRLKLKK